MKIRAQRGRRRTKREHVSVSPPCLWERFNTRQSGCDHLQQLATNTKTTDTTESVNFWNTKLCFVSPSDKAPPEFGLLAHSQN